MSWFKKIRPLFLNQTNLEDREDQRGLNFPKIWKTTVLVMAAVTLVPLVIITLVDYKVTMQSLESYAVLRTTRTTSNIKRTLSYYLAKHISVVDFLVRENSFRELNDTKHLEKILEHLKTNFEGFSDIGVIDSNGIMGAYAGDADLTGKDYTNQPWYGRLMAQGAYVSDIHLGYRNIPHCLITKRYLDEETNTFYTLRASVDTSQIEEVLFHLDLNEKEDGFLVNYQGVLQTSSRFHGKALDKIPYPVPAYSSKTQVIQVTNANGDPMILGYAYIPETSFILMVVKDKTQLLDALLKAKSFLLVFLGASITVILAVILCITTFLVNNMYLVDKRHAQSLQKIEYENKLSTIGRLAAGVAHEINNPLAVINEKAGLIKDMFIFSDKYSHDERLISLLDSIISSVARCGNITHRLLAFARNREDVFELVHPKELIAEVLGFMTKEAEYKNIDIHVDIPDTLSPMECNKGKMQQVFLNLVSNAFAAMDDSSGILRIDAQKKDSRHCVISVQDNGCGISQKDVSMIFEPFFTQKADQGGTGLGLSITHNLICEAGGSIEVDSEPGKGTTFMVTLPYIHKRGNKKDES